MPNSRSVSLAIYIGAGSRYETRDNAGVSHFVEHLCFRGTERRPTARDVCTDIEGVGGTLNGGTDKELTVYWSKVAANHFPMALDVLADILRDSKFDPEDIEKERQVITEEINMTQDTPFQLVEFLSDELLWPDQPLGRDPAGTKETVQAMTRQSLLDHIGQQYLPNKTVVSVAGNVPHSQVIEAMGEAFSTWEPHESLGWQPALDDQDQPHLHIEERDTEQAHLCLAVRGLPHDHPDRFRLDLLNVMLGEGMSSRLFTEIRDRKGLAYTIGSGVDHFMDAGSVTIYAGVAPRHLEDTVVAILEELQKLKESIPEEELSKAKELSKGRFQLRMEDTHNVARWMGSQELLRNKILTEDEALAIVDAMEAKDLIRVAGELFVTEKLNLTVVGPVKHEDRLASLLQV